MAFGNTKVVEIFLEYLTNKSVRIDIDITSTNLFNGIHIRDWELKWIANLLKDYFLISVLKVN